MGIEVTLTHDLPMHYDIISSVSKSEAWYMTNISFYIVEFSFHDDFYIIHNK